VSTACLRKLTHAVAFQVQSNQQNQKKQEERLKTWVGWKQRNVFIFTQYYDGDNTALAKRIYMVLVEWHFKHAVIQPYRVSDDYLLYLSDNAKKIYAFSRTNTVLWRWTLEWIKLFSNLCQDFYEACRL